MEQESGKMTELIALVEKNAPAEGLNKTAIPCVERYREPGQLIAQCGSERSFVAKTRQQLIAELDELRSRLAPQENERIQLGQALETLRKTEESHPSGEARYRTLT